MAAMTLPAFVLAVAAATASAPGAAPVAGRASPAAATASVPTLRIDLARYYATPLVEQTERAALTARIDAFAQAPAPPSTAAALLDLLRTHDALGRDLGRHAAYVHLRAEEDVDDHTAAAAEPALDALKDKLDAALRRSLSSLGRETTSRLIDAEPALHPYRYLVDTSLRAATVASTADRAIALLATPTLDSLGKSYVDLRRDALHAARAASQPMAASRESTWSASWAPYLANEAAFAALYTPIATLQEGAARLQGFAGTADAAYAARQLSTTQVHDVLAAIARSDAYARYTNVVAAAAARQLHVDVAQVRPWDLASADPWQPSPVAFADALPLIVDAARAMGPDYASQFERLFDPAERRVDWCRDAGCDDTGFSVGDAGTTSALFYGAFDGGINSLRATAHEAAHAVHRQFMNEHQPVAAYNEGPHFLFESFAIFNELLFLDHLQRGAPTRVAQARYLHQFLDDATFQVFGSAQETSLEEALHAQVRDGSARTAADLDALTLANLAAWLPPQRRAPAMKAAWARNRLYFSDPFYDVNYLFAGLLALDYLRLFERDPKDFQVRYVALLENGFDDAPAALLRRFLGIDLNDGTALVRDATALIDGRTTTLEGLYADCGETAASAATCPGR
jgi:oligoendopeptidase F